MSFLFLSHVWMMSLSGSQLLLNGNTSDRCLVEYWFDAPLTGFSHSPASSLRGRQHCSYFLQARCAAAQLLRVYRSQFKCWEPAGSLPPPSLLLKSRCRWKRAGGISETMLRESGCSNKSVFYSGSLLLFISSTSS